MDERERVSDDEEEMEEEVRREWGCCRAHASCVVRRCEASVPLYHHGVVWREWGCCACRTALCRVALEQRDCAAPRSAASVVQHPP